MAKVQFISETKVKDNSFINGNVDDKVLVPVIMDCQIDYILPIIGSGIYNELSSQITANSLTALNTTLLQDYIQPCLIKYVEMDIPIFLNFKYTNANMGKKNTDESVPMSLGEIKRVMDKCRTQAEMRGERITKFLKANYVDYPKYTNPGSSIDTVHPIRNNFTCGMYLGAYCEKCYSENCICMTNMVYYELHIKPDRSEIKSVCNGTRSNKR